MSTEDYLQQLPKSILNQDRTSNVGKLWRLFAEQVDLLNIEVQKVYSLYLINSQSGTNLDQIGKLVRQDRLPGENDADYRISLFAAIASGVSSGSIPDILGVINIIKGGDTTKFATLIEVFAAKIQIWTNMSELLSDNSKILNETRAAGVGLFLNYAPTGTPFVFLNDPDGLGFNDVTSELLELDDGNNLELDDGNLLAIVPNEAGSSGGEFVEII